MGAYKPPKLAYDGKQRKGAHESFDACSSREEHVLRELKDPFPLSVETPLPNDTVDAAYFSRDCPPEQLRAFWNSHLGKIEKMVQDSTLAQQNWDAAIPGGIKQDAGKLKTVAISRLMRQCGIGGPKWIRQFAHGVPITVELS